MQVHGWAAKEAGKPLAPHAFELPDPRAGEVQVEVETCGVCHSDLSMINNEWGFSSYPLVPGHEVIGKINKLGAGVTHLKVGQTVGVGWTSGSCHICDACVGGHQNLCNAVQATIVGRPGGFATHINAQALWTLTLPQNVTPEKAGPLLCGGATVFSPFVQMDVKPTDRVAILGVGGLGHLALQFANKWGCEVTALTSKPDKKPELLNLGAHHVVSSRDTESWKKHAGRFDFILVTANASLDWEALVQTLAPRGRLNFVGVVPDPIKFHVFSLLGSSRTVSASPSGPPAVMRTMLDFCARHHIEPVCEAFTMMDVNKALEHLHEGKARYRIVLHN